MPTPRDLIHKRRARLRLTQERAAELAGVSRQVWNGFETGRRGIGQVNAERLSKVLGGKPSEYLTRSAPADELGDFRRRLATLERRIEGIEKRLP